MYVIIGAGGYLGTYLIQNVLKHTEENILAVARNPRPESTHNERVAWEACDVADPASTERFCERYLAGKVSETRGVLS